MPHQPLPSCLIVDDEENICLLLNDFLSERSFRVTAVTTRRDAVTAVKNEEFDIVLVDKNLPDGSGLDVAAMIRKLNQSSEIIIITGYSDLDSALASFELGVYRYLKKPFELGRLSAEVSGAVETRRLKQELKTRTADLEAANLRLKQSEERFRELAELLPGIVFETDARGMLSFINQTGLAISGLMHEEFAARFNNQTLIDDADRARWQATLDAVLEGNPIEVGEFSLFGADRRIPMLMQAACRPEGGIRAVLLDITARKAAEHRLREKEMQLQLSQKMEAVGSLAGGMAHDFNNMLGVIRGCCDVLLLDLDENNPLREDIFGIIEASERSAELTRQLLAFSKRQVMVPEVMDLNIVVQEMDKMLRRLLPEDILLETRFPRNSTYINADKSQLEQVILNLAINARDAMPDGGTLEIETAHVLPEKGDAPLVRLTVADTGTGMDASTVGRIFEPFFTTKAQGKGTGLGLATVYGIITQFGGTIAVDSTPGRGTRFDILLKSTESHPKATSAIPPEIEFLSGDETILVVEDEGMLLDVVSRILRNYGYTVLKSRQGGDALLLCETHNGPIDLLLVDIVLPRMNGADLAERLRRFYPDMSVLYMSGYADFATVQKVMADHAEHFIAKPFSARTLATKVRERLTSTTRNTKK